MNEITLRHQFTGDGTSPPYRVTGPALLVQTDGLSATLQGSNLPEDSASWQDLGVCTGYTPLKVTTSFAYIRVVGDGAGVVAVSGAAAPAAGAGGGGGGGSSDTTEATQLLVKAAVQAINTKTPELSGGKSPVIDTETRDLVQTTASRLGAADEAPAASDTAPAGLNGLVRRALQNWTTLLARIPELASGRVPVDPTGAVQTGTGAVTTKTQRVTLATDGPGVANLSSIDGKLPASLGGKSAAASLSVTAATGTITSVGGTVAAGGTAQQLAAANTERRGLTVQNTSAGELRVNVFGTASASAGYRVMAGELLVLDAPHCGVGAVSIWGATTGQAFVGGEAV